MVTTTTTAAIDDSADEDETTEDDRFPKNASLTDHNDEATFGNQLPTTMKLESQKSSPITMKEALVPAAAVSYRRK